MVLIVYSAEVVLDKVLLQSTGVGSAAFLLVNACIISPCASRTSLTTFALARLRSDLESLCLTSRSRYLQSRVDIEAAFDVELPTPYARRADFDNATFATMYAR